jgi:hypothetical protein
MFSQAIRGGVRFILCWGRVAYISLLFPVTVYLLDPTICFSLGFYKQHYSSMLHSNDIFSQAIAGGFRQILRGDGEMTILLLSI